MFMHAFSKTPPSTTSVITSHRFGLSIIPKMAAGTCSPKYKILYFMNHASYHFATNYNVQKFLVSLFIIT